MAYGLTLIDVFKETYLLCNQFHSNDIWGWLQMMNERDTETEAVVQYKILL
jgi:hypothetical protein